jgi:hypothetical protein
VDIHWAGLISSALDNSQNYSESQVPGSSDTLLLDPAYMLNFWPADGESIAGAVYNFGQIKGGSWHGIVFNNDPTSTYTGLVDAAGRPIFLNKLTFDMGASWLYGPEAADDPAYAIQLQADIAEVNAHLNVIRSGQVVLTGANGGTMPARLPRAMSHEL